MRESEDAKDIKKEDKLLLSLTLEYKMTELKRRLGYVALNMTLRAEAGM